MAELVAKWDDHHEYIWKCDCGDWHYLELCWDEPDSDWRWLNVVDTYRAYRIRDRLQAAWTVLRGRPHYHSGVLLNEQSVAELLAVLSKHAKDAPDA